MRCGECGEELYYSGGCLGEWEHLNGSRECTKKKDNLSAFAHIDLTETLKKVTYDETKIKLRPYGPAARWDIPRKKK